MESKAKLKYLIMAPRKVRLVADQMRGQSVAKSKSFLKFTVKKATAPLLKLLDSAVANAKNDFDLDEPNLYISEIRVDEGPKIKRWMPRARGSASQIQKKTSHITLVLSEIKESIKPTKKSVSKEAEATSVVKPDEVKGAVQEKRAKVRWKREGSAAKKMVDAPTGKKIFRRKSI